MSNDRLPFTRPDIDEATIARVADVLRSGWLASGPMVKEFEKGLSTYLGGAAVRTLTSATEGLEIALLAAGIGPGDEVITPAMSFCATANTAAPLRGPMPVSTTSAARSPTMMPTLGTNWTLLSGMM